MDYGRFATFIGAVGLLSLFLGIGIWNLNAPSQSEGYFQCLYSSTFKYTGAKSDLGGRWRGRAYQCPDEKSPVFNGIGVGLILLALAIGFSVSSPVSVQAKTDDLDDYQRLRTFPDPTLSSDEYRAYLVNRFTIRKNDRLGMFSFREDAPGHLSEPLLFKTFEKALAHGDQRFKELAAASKHEGRPSSIVDAKEVHSKADERS